MNANERENIGDSQQLNPHKTKKGHKNIERKKERKKERKTI